MATNLIHYRPVGISACASSGHRKSDVLHRKHQPSSSNWWTPLFGWSSDPDYIDSGATNNNNKEKADSPTKSDTGSVSMSRSGRGAFTEEKARQLRMITNDTASFHDAMYHSAIASRLASDFSDRSDDL